MRAPASFGRHAPTVGSPRTQHQIFYTLRRSRKRLWPGRLCIRPETYCTEWGSEMACRYIGMGTGSKGLAGSRIMAYVFWPWSARKPSIDIGCCYFGRDTDLSRRWRPSRSTVERSITGESSSETARKILSRSMRSPEHPGKDENGCGRKRSSMRSAG